MTSQCERGLAQAVAVHSFDIIGSIPSVSVEVPVIIYTPWKDSPQGAMFNIHRAQPSSLDV